MGLQYPGHKEDTVVLALFIVFSHGKPQALFHIGIWAIDTPELPQHIYLILGFIYTDHQGHMNGEEQGEPQISIHGLSIKRHRCVFVLLGLELWLASINLNNTRRKIL